MTVAESRDKLMLELETEFDLSYPLAGRTLGEAVEKRLCSLEPEGLPDWGTGGSMTQLAARESGALDFYYRPHLFPGMDEALRLGHRLQFDLLPRHLPETSPVRIAAVLESYCHLSGDLLGWRMEGEELFFWIADVSGHGVRAGMAAATLYFLIDDVEAHLAPEDFAGRVNQRMYEARNPDDPNPLFVTGIWLRAGPGGRVRYASAGHHPILGLRASGDVVERFPSTGPPLGLFPKQGPRGGEIALGPEDGLCLFTDGLVEAPNPAGEEYGTERLGALWRGRMESPMELARRVYHAVRDHRDGGMFEDDLAFLVVDQA